MVKNSTSMDEKKPIVFFVRNKPQGADIIDLVLNKKRVFIGYPPFKKNCVFDENKILACTFDISKDSPDDCKKNIRDPKKFSKGIQTNINLVKDAVPDSFVIIPRPERGKYYIGKIKKFELVNDPLWIEDYKEIRLKQKLKWEEKSGGHQYHVGDVIQSWVVEKDFEAISPFEFPGWLRYSLFGQSTIGRISHPLILDNEDKYNKVYDIVSKLYNKEKIDLSNKDLKDKLLYYLSPETFEHFMCNLLLLENKKSNQIWIHIGGSGDGGVDCIGFDKNTKQTVGIAQCKLKKQTVNDMRLILKDLKDKNKSNKNCNFYICNFYCEEGINEGEDLEIYNQERILKLFEKHKDSNYWDIIGELKII